MNEMELLTRLRAEVPPAVAAATEEKVLAQIAADDPPRRGRRFKAVFRAVGPVRPGRARWRLAVAGGLTLGLTAGLLAAATARIGGESPADSASAATVLADRAAAAALAQPWVPPGQWVYRQTLVRQPAPVSGPVSNAGHCTVLRVRTDQLPVLRMHVRAGQHPVVRLPVPRGGGCILVVPEPGSRLSAPPPPAPPVHGVQERWSTADGTRNAYYTADGGLIKVAACPCGMVSYGDLGKLPHDPQALARFAMRRPGGQGQWTTSALAWNAFNGIEGTLTSYAVPPRVAAALFRALADIPGVTVQSNAVDAAGRHGPAFVITTNQKHLRGTAKIFLDPRTYRLMGYDEDLYGAPGPVGTARTAILHEAFVSGPGVRP